MVAVVPRPSVSRFNIVIGMTAAGTAGLITAVLAILPVALAAVGPTELVTRLVAVL